MASGGERLEMPLNVPPCTGQPSQQRLIGFEISTVLRLRNLDINSSQISGIRRKLSEKKARFQEQDHSNMVVNHHWNQLFKVR